MADKQRDDDREPLNERERQVLEELERQMVREVEEPGRLENDKARVDLWRIIVFLNIALMAGIGAMGAFLDRPLPSSNHLLVVSVALNLSGLLLSLFALAGAGRRGCLYGVRAVGVVDPGIRGEQPQRPASLAAASLLQTFVCDRLLFTNFGEERFSDEAHYRCVYDKVGEAGGIIEFEVPEKSS